jgi:hypothetical protein
MRLGGLQFVTSQDAPQTLKSDIAAAGLPINGTQAYTLQESWRALSEANLHRLSLLLVTTSCGFRFSQVRDPHSSYIQQWIQWALLCASCARKRLGLG